MGLRLFALLGLVNDETHPPPRGERRGRMKDEIPYCEWLITSAIYDNLFFPKGNRELREERLNIADQLFAQATELDDYCIKTPRPGAAKGKEG